MDQYSRITKIKGQEIPHYRLLFVGQTGAGKTTLINMFINTILNMDYSEERIVAISQRFSSSQQITCNVELFKPRQSLSDSVTQSQTQIVHFYSIKGPQYKITLVDTPGLLDTKGIKYDAQHLMNIVASVQKLKEINAICYVHKGDDMRSVTHLKYYIQEIKGILPKQYQENFFVCFTFQASSQIPAQEVLEESGILQKVKDDMKTKKFIFLDNSCLMPLTIYKFQDEEQKKDEEETQRKNWTKAKRSINSLIENIKGITPLETQSIMELHIKKESIKRVIIDKAILIKETKTIEDSLNENMILLQESQKQLKQEQIVNPQFIKKTRIVQKKMVRVGWKDIDLTSQKSKITQCSLCYSYCHDPCYLDSIYLKGSISLKHCHCINKSTKCCNVEGCQHPVEFHRHTQIKRQQVQEEYLEDFIEPYNQEAKNQPNDAQSLALQESVNQYDQLIKTKQNQICEKKKEIDKLMRYVIFIYQDIQKISLEPINNMLLQYLKESVISVCKDGKTSEAQKKTLLKSLEETIQRFELITEEFKQAGNSKIIALTDQEIQDLQFQVISEKNKIEILAEQERHLAEEHGYKENIIKAKNGEVYYIS